MAEQRDIVYKYDGTLEGLLCCVFESYARDELPALIQDENAGQVCLYPSRRIETRPALSRRVSIAIHQKICPDALVLVRLGFLTCLDEREMHILRFVRWGFEDGVRIMGMVKDSRLDLLQKAVNHMQKEQHLLKGFVRFSDIGSALVAEIEPKNFVLPLVARHFADRYPQEAFMIYDRTHGAALLHAHGQKEIVRLAGFRLPPPNPEEQKYRTLWKQFYDTIAIESRNNPRCRMSLMPKRYWSVMTEFIEQAPMGEEQRLLPSRDRLKLLP